jgi:esterase/lipase
MTQPFPESVLSTIDEGSPVKEVMAEFMRHYDTRRYAFENYYNWINAPILIQQGTADDQVKVEWQQAVVKGIGGDKAKLVVYEGADHNLKNSWEEAVKKNLSWFDMEWR